MIQPTLEGRWGGVGGWSRVEEVEQSRKAKFPVLNLKLVLEIEYNNKLFTM